MQIYTSMYKEMSAFSLKCLCKQLFTHPCCYHLCAVELILNHELELKAIQAIHEQLDDNDDGNVDLSESSEVCVVLTA